MMENKMSGDYKMANGNVNMNKGKWMRIGLVALIIFAFWWMFVKKSGYSLCNLAEYSSDVQSAMPPAMVDSVADVSVTSQTVASASVGMGSSGYLAKGGCGCGK